MERKIYSLDKVPWCTRLYSQSSQGCPFYSSTMGAWTKFFKSCVTLLYISILRTKNTRKNNTSKKFSNQRQMWWFPPFDKCFMCFTNVLCMWATSAKGKKVLRKRFEFTPQKPYFKKFSGASPHTLLGALTALPKPPNCKEHSLCLCAGQLTLPKLNL